MTTAPRKKAGTAAKARNTTSEMAAYDARPFFEKVLDFGAREGLLADAIIGAMRAEGPKGMVQIADFFGTAFLRANLEEARLRIVTLASLYLEEFSGGDLLKAARSLRDGSFLSHSRGGSEMLKKLHALPKSTLFGDDESEPVADFLAEWSLYGLNIAPAYRAALQERQGTAHSMSAATWFGDRMGIAHSALSHQFASAEAVMRTAILLRLGKQTTCPNRAEFARLVLDLRTKGIPARAMKSLQASPDDIPEAFRAIEAAILAQIEQYDLPRIIDATLPPDQLIRLLEERYFLRASLIDEVSEYDAMVSAEWHKVMKGRAEADARLTVFVCLAAGMPPKPALSDTAARALVRKLRAQGFDSEAVLKFIEASAPYDLRESLVELWNEEFLPDAELALLDASDAKLVRAMAFLRENCHINPAPAANKKLTAS